ncbi:hypothetical protein CDV36_003829 [Fusarium kuroshium]|uniref:Uncharacterized protein n=1 Tax=Fusarium kuroshium TaxID=2010991 RepID=A0A3M2SGR4_9HYPO|nr:hypothetical protein CDV36_003829 [Fusarium kuroshium]
MSEYCITTTTCSPSKAWYKDEALYEFTSTDLFWLIAIFIMVNCWWMGKYCEPFAELVREAKESEKAAKESDRAEKKIDDVLSEPEKTETEPDKTLNEPDNIEPPKSLASQNTWLGAKITSESRRRLAVTISALVIPIQLLHGSWVLRTLWRWTIAFVKATYPSIRPLTLSFIIYSPVTLAIVVTWMAFGFTGAFFVTTQLLRVNNINEMKLNVPEKTGGKGTQKVDDEEWDEVDKNSEQGENRVCKEKNIEQKEEK